jgi:ABC-type branched-subunit amino acid transport system ATPase component
MVQHLENIVGDLKKDGLSILLVEQNLYSALAVADRVYILETGRVVHEASSNEIARVIRRSNSHWLRGTEVRLANVPPCLPTSD